MSIPVPPRPYQVCDPDEKLRRLKISYADNRINLEELEHYTELALLEADLHDAERIGVELTPQQQETRTRLDREREARMKAWRSRP